MATPTSLPTVNQPITNGFYNNTLFDMLKAKKGDKEAAWLKQNRISTGSAFDFHALYDVSELIAHKDFPKFLQTTYAARMKHGAAWGGSATVDKVIKWNASHEVREQFAFLVSEIEDYGNSTTTPAEFKQMLVDNYKKAKKAGLPFGVYEGWTKQWDVVVANSDFCFLHSYRSSDNMEKPFDAWDYTDGRLILIAEEAKKQKKKYAVQLLSSCEPEFGMKYFKKHGWSDYYATFIKAVKSEAPKIVKDNLIISGSIIFDTEYCKQAKPLK